MRFSTVVFFPASLTLVAAAPADRLAQIGGTIAIRDGASMSNTVDVAGYSIGGVNEGGMSDQEAILADEAAADAQAASAEDMTAEQFIAELQSADNADHHGHHHHDDDDHKGKAYPNPFDHCAKYEKGCKYKGKTLEEGLLSPGVSMISSHLKHKRGRLNLRRFAFSCLGSQEGPQIGKTDYLEKYKCKDWKKEHDGDMAINFLLPSDKSFNHCDVKLYNEHHCEGSPFEVIHGVDDSFGNSSTQTFNAQAHCIEATGMRSFSIGPCS